MSTFIVEIRIGNGTASHTVIAPNKEVALSLAKQRLEACGLKGKLPNNIEAFSKVIKVK
jgi:hypothetical protein